MPRPLSSTVTEPSLLIVTEISRGVAGHRLVDRVVDHFVDEVVQAAGGRVGDVHARPLADVLQVAQVFEVLGAVVGIALRRVRGDRCSDRGTGLVLGDRSTYGFVYAFLRPVLDTALVGLSISDHSSRNSSSQDD